MHADPTDARRQHEPAGAVPIDRDHGGVVGKLDHSPDISRAAPRQWPPRTARSSQASLRHRRLVIVQDRLPEFLAKHAAGGEKADAG